MTSVTSAGAATSTATTQKSSATSAKGIADNFDQFLQLLTTQLKNQNPLDPLDTNQFTQQLVQYAGVEQQLKTNDTLSALLASNKVSNLTNANGFVGATITADGTTTSLRNGKASWQLNAPRTGSATITIRDSKGNDVYSTSRTLSAGDQAFTWNGRNANGVLSPDGQYSIVVAAKDASGQVMTVKSEFSGVVESVDVSGDTPILQVGGIAVATTAVKSIRR